MVVYKCSGETISIPFDLAEYIGGENGTIGKLEMLTIVSILDLVCATILIWSIMSLQAMSDDRLDEIASGLVEIKDFVIQLNQLKVDKYSQDERILQMKLWLKVNESLENNQIIDMTFGSMRFGNMKLIYQMHRVKEEIKRLEAVAELKDTTNWQKDKIKLEQKDLEKRYDSLS